MWIGRSSVRTPASSSHRLSLGYLLETLRSPTQLLDAGATTTSRSDADHALNLIDGGALRQSAAQCAAFDFYADGASERLRLNTRGENAVAFPVDSTSST